MMPHLAVAACKWGLLFGLAGLGAVASARPHLDSDGMSKLDRYDVLTFLDPYRNGIDRGKAIGVIDAAPDEVFRIATDYAKYKDFMPRIRSSSVLSRDRNAANVVISADLPWPVGSSWVLAHYDMMRGTFRQYLGSLYIEPWAPNKTAITYELVAEPNSVFASHGAINRGVRRLVGKFVHALRQRINELHRLGSLHPNLRDSAIPRPGLAPIHPSSLKVRR
jgi:ribosome-associated toxin RatA of RatAB toxin-antitoxin module